MPVGGVATERRDFEHQVREAGAAAAVTQLVRCFTGDFRWLKHKGMVWEIAEIAN